MPFASLVILALLNYLYRKMGMNDILFVVLCIVTVVLAGVGLVIDIINSPQERNRKHED